MVCPERTLISITRGIDEAYWACEYPLRPQTELHGYDLFHSEKDFERHAQTHRNAAGELCRQAANFITADEVNAERLRF